MALETSLYDEVVDILLERQRLLKSELAERFKKTKPFRMTPVSNDEALVKYNMLTPEQVDELVATDGRDATNKYIFEMEQLKKRRGL